MDKKYGLVLTGGGARAAYQAGVLKGLAEILEGVGASKVPFQVITGVSAGAINGAFLASKAENFKDSTQKLCLLWSELEIDQVIKTDFASFTLLGTRWLKDLSLGGILGSSRSSFLLDSRPLRKFLTDQLDFSAIQHNLKSALLHGFAVSATNYKTGTAISFFAGDPHIRPWARSSRIGLRSKIELNHVLASAAIPILFPPVKIGASFYGDGGIRLATPLSPAIHLGADRILAIGIRYARPDQYTWDINQLSEMTSVSVADIAGVMLNAAFLDALDADVERMMRINQTLSLMSEEALRQHPQKLRPIPIYTIRPSQDLGSIASDQFSRFPRMLRYLMRGIGVSDQQGWDFLSYMAFDRNYTDYLIDLGYKDTLSQKEDLIRFFKE